MRKKEIHLNEKDWQRKRLFKTRRISPILRISLTLSIVIVLVLFAWLSEILPFNPLS